MHYVLIWMCCISISGIVFTTMFFFFFFKQKTAYEMRISDWSSDVCSSDLPCRIAERDDIGVGGGFEERRTRRDHEQRRQEYAVNPDLGRRIEQHRPQRIETEPAQYPRAIAEAPHQHPRRQGHQEIAEIEDELDQSGLSAVEIECLLKMADQYVVEIVRDRPEEEKAGDEREAQLEPRRDEAAGSGLPGIGGGGAARRGGGAPASPPSR